jgi:hypothetical protein
MQPALHPETTDLKRVTLRIAPHDQQNDENGQEARYDTVPCFTNDGTLTYE